MSSMEPSCSVSNLSFGNSDTDISGKLRLVEVLDIRLAEIRDLCVRHSPLSSSSSSSSSSGSDKRIFCVVKLDREEIFRSSAVARTQNPCFGDDLHFEVPKNFTCLSFFVFDQIQNRVARPIGRVTFRKQDLAKYSGFDRWWRLKPMNRQSDVTGKVWLEITRAPSAPTSGNVAIFDTNDSVGGEKAMGHSLAVRVLDYCDLNHARSNDLYAVVSLAYPDGTHETKKLRMRRKPPSPPSAGVSTSSQSATALCSQEAATFALKSFLSNEVDTEVAAPLLRVSVWHDILGSFSSYFHGEVRVPVDASLNSQMGNPEQAFRAWYSLTPRSGSGNINNNNNVNSGQNNAYGSGDVFSAVSTSMSSNGGKEGEHLGCLRLKITYSVDHILPVECYNDLWAHLLGALSVKPFRCSIAGILAALPRTDLEHVARPLIRIFLHSEQLRPFIQVLCSEEIAQCQDVNTLFRSSSLASKCIYELMKLVGQQYLVSTLKPVIDKIFAERQCCEIDPNLLGAGANIEENASRLTLYTEMALSRICDSSHRCPPLLKDVFRILRETTQRYHPNDPAVQWLVLSSFLIMRFFAAALLNPKLFWLKRENPDPTVQRTLALMSKIIQRLCNYVVVGHALTEKEPFLTPIFERFADENHRLGFTKFFDRVSCAGGEYSITGESITVLKEGILIERVPKKSKRLQSTFSDQSSSSSTSSASSLCFNFRNVLQRSTSRPRFCCLSETDFSWYKEKGQTLVGRISLADVRVVQMAEELFNNALVLEIGSDRHHVFLEASNKVELGEWIVALQRACKRQRLTQQQLTENAAQMYEIDLNQQLETIHMIFLENYEIMRAWKDHMAFGNPLPENTASYEGHLANVDGSGRNTFYNSVDQVMECVLLLEQTHIKHFRNIQYGSKDMPIGDDNYLLLGSRMRDYAAVWAGGGGARIASEAYSLAADLEKALEGAAAPPLPPKPATVAVLHYPQTSSSSLDV